MGIWGIPVWLPPLSWLRSHRLLFLNCALRGKVFVILSLTSPLWQQVPWLLSPELALFRLSQATGLTWLASSRNQGWGNWKAAGFLRLSLLGSLQLRVWAVPSTVSLLWGSFFVSLCRKGIFLKSAVRCLGSWVPKPFRHFSEHSEGL